MKTLKECSVMIAMLCTFIFVLGCDKTEVSGSISISGKVDVSPSIAKVGDEVTITILGIDDFLKGSSTNINGKETLKSIVYYIDGDEISESSDRVSKFTIKYKVSELAVGAHTVTARCESNFKDVVIKENISSGSLTIEE